MKGFLREKHKEGEVKPTRYFSKKQEATVAEDTKGRRTPNSGATAWVKSDVLTDQFTIECKTKTTHAESISIKKEWIDKQKQESTFMGKPYWSISFSFGPDEDNYYIVDKYLFQELLDYLQQKSGQ